MKGKMYPITGEDISTLIGLILGVSIASGVGCNLYKTYGLLHRGKLVHEEKYVVKGRSDPNILERGVFSASPIGKDRLIFFDPHSEKIKSAIESEDTLTLHFSDRQWKYLNDKGEVPIKDRNLKYVNRKRFN